MDSLHATIEEFAAEGYTHIERLLPAMPHDEVEADQLPCISPMRNSRQVQQNKRRPCDAPSQGLQGIGLRKGPEKDV